MSDEIDQWRGVKVDPELPRSMVLTGVAAGVVLALVCATGVVWFVSRVSSSGDGPSGGELSSAESIATSSTAGAAGEPPSATTTSTRSEKLSTQSTVSAPVVVSTSTTTTTAAVSVASATSTTGSVPPSTLGRDTSDGEECRTKRPEGMEFVEIEAVKGSTASFYGAEGTSVLCYNDKHKPYIDKGDRVQCPEQYLHCILVSKQESFRRIS